MNVIVVRREKVILEVESEVAAALTRDAAAAALLTRELNRLSGQSVTTGRATQNVSRDNDTIARSASKADASINKLTGRLRLIADVAAILGPALVPIGALGVPAVAGLANQLGVAALAGGTAIIAFQGVGDALKAVNTAALEPTTANLQKAQEAMEKLSPAAREMVNRLQELRPVLTGIRDAGAEGMFPGVVDGIDELEKRAGDFERVVGNMGSALGSLLADAGADLASERWDEFFDFLATDATQTLASMGRATGSLAHGMAELWMAFDPLNDDFGSWVEDVASGFDSWATGLSQTQGFAEFIDYVRSTGPQVADTFVALADAVLEIAEAAAPLGGPVLQALEGIAKAAAAIADSDLGTPIMAGVAALALLSRATRTYQAVASTAFGGRLVGSIGGMVTALGTVTTAQDRARLSAVQLQRAEAQRASAVRGGLATMGKATAGLAALTLASTGAADSIGLTNTVTLGLLGTLGGPWGAAAGASVGLMRDLAESTGDLSGALDRAKLALATGDLEDMRAALADLSDEYNKATDLRELYGGYTDLKEQLGDLFSGDLAGVLEDSPIGKLSGLLRAQFGETEKVLDQLDGSLSSSAAKYGWLGSVMGDFVPDFEAMRDATQRTAAATTTLAEAVGALSGVLDRRDAMRNYTESMEDLRATIKESGPDSREAAQAFDDVARNILTMAEHMRGPRKVRFLAGATEELEQFGRALGLPPRMMRPVIAGLRETAAAADKTSGAQRTLITQYKLTPKQVATAIEQINMGKSQSEIRSLLKQYGLTPKQIRTAMSLLGVAAAEAALNNLARDRSLNVYVHYRGTPGGREAPDIGLAGGGPVIGPGTSTSDSVRIRGSNGEHMWTAREVANAGGHAAMEAMRAQFRARPVHTRGTTGTQRIAVTATTGPLSANTSLSDRDIDRLAAALYAAARAGMSDRATVGQRRLTAALVTGGGF